MPETVNGINTPTLHFHRAQDGWLGLHGQPSQNYERPQQKNRDCNIDDGALLGPPSCHNDILPVVIDVPDGVREPADGQDNAGGRVVQRDRRDRAKSKQDNTCDLHNEGLAVMMAPPEHTPREVNERRNNKTVGKVSRNTG